jgi:uncharacterized phosphosugar-binding protein
MLAETYLETISGLIQKLRETQMETVHAAARRIAPLMERGGILYAFGTGHSHITAIDITKRAGGLVQAKALLPYELTLDANADKTMLMERMDGLADVLFATTPIRREDALIIISNSGRNAVPIQMALLAKERGIFTVALTNVAHSKSVASRDKSGKRLYEVCDMVLDMCGVPGDTAVPVPGAGWSTGPTSTVAGSMLLQAMMCDIIEIMLQDGVVPAVFQSMNLDGNDDSNRLTTERLYQNFPELKYYLK